MITNTLLLHRDESYCAIYLINHGWRVEGQTFAVEFSSTGEATQFTCSLNGEEFECESGILSQYQQVTAFLFLCLNTPTSLQVLAHLSSLTSLLADMPLWYIHRIAVITTAGRKFSASTINDLFIEILGPYVFDLEPHVGTKLDC